MEYKFAFEKLEVWQLSKELIKKVYKLTKYYPKEEMFNLISQSNRAVVSIAANIAEGSSRKTPNDQGHFYTFAYSSTIELISHLIVSFELGFIKKEEDFLEAKELARVVSNKINALQKSLYVDNNN